MKLKTMHRFYISSKRLLQLVNHNLFTILLLALLLHQNAAAQKSTTNRTDSLGNRAGRWETFYNWGGKKSEGYYVAGKKVGLWTYYINGDHDTQAPERTVTYYTNGRFEEKGPYIFDIWPSYLLIVNSDSSEISGIIYHDRSKQPCIECKKQKDDIICSRFLVDGHKVKTFKLKNMTELFLLIRGMNCIY